MYNEIDELQKSVKSLEREVHSMWKAIGILQIIADNIDLKNNDKSTREEVEQRVFILGKVVSKLQVAIDNQDLKNRQYEEKFETINKVHRQFQAWKNDISPMLNDLKIECLKICGMRERHEKEISKLDDRIYIMENDTKIEVEFNECCGTRFYIKDKEGVKNFIEDVTDEYSKNIEKLTKKDILHRLTALERKVSDIK